MFLNDLELTHAQTQFNIINPFKRYTDLNKQEKPSSGLSCCGYDLTLGSEFKYIEKTENITPIDPRNPPKESMYKKINLLDKEFITINPGQFILGCSKEYIQMPDTMVGFIMDKSSLMRLALTVFNTILEPGWSGIVTIEIANFNTRPIILHPGMGICQLVLSRVTKPTKNYLQKSGKYQGQTGVTIAR